MATFHSALVTGANRGLGYQFIVDLLGRTTHLIATARDVEKATELRKLAAKHPNLHILQLELTDYKRHESFASEVAKIVGENGLTLFIQNAGFLVKGDLSDTTPETYAKLYDINAIAPILLARQLMPLLKKSAAGGVRTIASFIGSLAGSVEFGSKLHSSIFIAYRMSKSALNQGVRTLANHYKDEPIDFVILHPGHVATGGYPGYRSVHFLNSILNPNRLRKRVVKRSSFLFSKRHGQSGSLRCTVNFGGERGRNAKAIGERRAGKGRPYDQLERRATALVVARALNVLFRSFYAKLYYRTDHSLVMRSFPK